MAEQTAAADWRGVGGEESEVDATGNLVLAGRSRRLLASLVRPYKKQALLSFLIILVDNITYVAGPLFIAYALDNGVGAAAGFVATSAASSEPEGRVLESRLCWVHIFRPC